MSDLNKVIEYTNVKTGCTVGEVRSLCKQAIINGYRAVCVNSGFVRFCYEELKDHPEVKIVATAGFPTGGGSFKAKVFEAIFAAEEGAKEIDFDDEIKKEAARIAAYGIIKEMYEKGMINSYELSYIKNKYKVDIE